MKNIEGRFGERFMEISGGRREINKIEEVIKEIEETDEKYDTVSQIFDAEKIAGENHLLHSSKLALDALEEERSFADSPRIELTCWTAGLRQINKALEKVGITEESKEIALVTIGKKQEDVKRSQESIFRKIGISKNPKVLEITEEKKESLKEAFSISQGQIEVSSLEKIILEKIALLSLKK